MAKISRQTKRKRTLDALNKSLQDSGLESRYYIDQVEVYMNYWDTLEDIQECIKKGVFDPNLSKEMRLITKEMRSILEFLGLKPEKQGASGKYAEL